MQFFVILGLNNFVIVGLNNFVIVGLNNFVIVGLNNFVVVGLNNFVIVGLDPTIFSKKFNMDFIIRHSIPGRIRIRYDRAKISRRQAALAHSLLSVQKGMTDVNVNYTTGSFLIYYDTAMLSEKHIRSYFMALSDKYLKNQEMLDAVEEPREEESLLFDLACMTVWHYFKQIYRCR